MSAETYILALCPNTGPERFEAFTGNDGQPLKMSYASAQKTGQGALTERTHRAFQLWQVGPTFRAQVTIVQDQPATTPVARLERRA
jgi:hypothetical protein